jgi:hypothetical protein
MIEAAEIAVLFPDSTLSQPSSAQLGWSGLAIERRTVQPGEKPEITIGHYFLVLWDRYVAEGESKYRRRQFTPYRKYPNTITTCLPGVRPAARNRSKHEVIVCSIDPAFLHGVEDEMDKHPDLPILPVHLLPMASMHVLGNGFSACDAASNNLSSMRKREFLNVTSRKQPSSSSAGS